MFRNPLILFFAGLALLTLVLNSLFVVRQDQQAILLRFGQFTSAINEPGASEPGLYFKLPFVESVIFYDRRNIGTTLEGEQFNASDQEILIVDAIVRWKITDPRRFYQSALTEEAGADRLATFTEAAMRRVLASATSNDVISGRRAELMRAIETNLNEAAASELGVQVIDVRIRQADQPEETRERVYERMRSERQQVAGRIRAEGDRRATVIRATARQESERLRGEGDGERARIFAQAYGRDPEFAAFYRSMIAYESALQAGTPIVVPPDSDFFRYMQRRRGQ
ncbi:MAG: protease modulator HflC [Hyphomonadaceae bacterium]|nr:protease modulator HflC [Hyphomonadaceae bacterium]